MMEYLKIPGAPLPPKKMLAVCQKFRGVGSTVAKIFPQLESQLKQAGLNVPKEIYGAAMFASCAFYFSLAFLLVLVAGFVISSKSPKPIESLEILKFAFGVGFFSAAMVGMQVMVYPSIMLSKKVRDLERNLIFALRTILVEVRAGVTLFDAINIVANGNNGQVSAEFRKAIEKINTGKFQNNALEEIAENNPSLYFRRAIWQLVNGLKAGSDVSLVMESLVRTLSTEKANQVRKYGNSMKMLSLVYMMLGAIVPAMGLTLMIILSTFPQIKLGEPMFWGMLGTIIVAQFMFLGVVKNARPSLLGD